MKPNDEISKTLKQWRIVVPPSDSFCPQVWGRIEAGRADQNQAGVRPRLGLLGALCLLALLLSTWSGHAYARSRVAAERETLASNYLIQLDARAQSELTR